MSGCEERRDFSGDSRSDLRGVPPVDASVDSESKGESQAAGSGADPGAWWDQLSAWNDAGFRCANSMPRLPSDWYPESSVLPQGETARREAEAASQVHSQGTREEREEELSSWWFGALITFGLAALLGVCWAIRYL